MTRAVMRFGSLFVVHACSFGRCCIAFRGPNAQAGTMSRAEDELPEIAAEADPAFRPNHRLLALVALVAVFALGLTALWLQRENLAHKIIGRQLSQYDLPATYRLEKVGPLEQVLTQVVVGDPARPDFTADRVEIHIAPTLGLPTIGRVRLIRPRLYGAYRSGTLTFGKLDRVLFAPGPRRAPGLPDFELELEDGRARIETDFGAVGIKADGQGNLRNAFDGRLAAIAPGLRMGACRLTNASAYGRVTSNAGVPKFSGPLRIGGAQCPDLSIGRLAMQADLQSSADLSDLAASGTLAGGPADWAGQRAAGLAGKLTLSTKAGKLAATYDLAVAGLSGPLAARKLGLSGTLRADKGLARLEGEGRLEGTVCDRGRCRPETRRIAARRRRHPCRALARPVPGRSPARRCRQPALGRFHPAPQW